MRRTLVILAGLALVLLFAPVPSAYAMLGCNECGTGCTNYCSLVHNAACSSYSHSCAADGTGTCFYLCSDGSSSSGTCGCSTQPPPPPPSGSPIFKKPTPQEPPQQSTQKKAAAKDSKSKEKDKSAQAGKK